MTDQEILIKGLKDQILEAHSRLNRVLERAMYVEPKDARKPMRYPCDPKHPMTEINGEYQSILSEIKDLALRLGRLGVDHI